jgi:hypothetical protein
MQGLPIALDSLIGRNFSSSAREIEWSLVVSEFFVTENSSLLNET